MDPFATGFVTGTIATIILLVFIVAVANFGYDAGRKDEKEHRS